MTTQSKHFIIPLALALALLAVAAVPASRAAEDGNGPSALRAAKVVTGTGTVHADGVVLIRDGKIEAVGSGLTIPAGYEVRDYGQAVIAPGMVDPYTALGAAGHNTEPAHAVEPGAAAEDVFDRFHADFERALAQGITSVLIVPSADNIVGGTCAAVKTAGCRHADRILRTGGPLALSLSRAAFQSNRAPTSRVGAVDLLKRTIAEARSDDSASPALREFSQGRLDGFFYAGERYDIAMAASLQKEFGLKMALVNVSDAWKMVDELRAAGMPVILGPFSYETADRSLAAPGRAAAAGVKVAFTSGAPNLNPASLRITAALAVRSGMDPDQALRALTSNPAEITGVAHRVGSIGPGKDADLAVFSGEPLDLTSRVVAVYVDGIAAYIGPAPECQAETEVR